MIPANASSGLSIRREADTIAALLGIEDGTIDTRIARFCSIVNSIISAIVLALFLDRSAPSHIHIRYAVEANLLLETLRTPQASV